jgi:autotransporter-associated beta strand protein
MKPRHSRHFFASSIFIALATLTSQGLAADLVWGNNLGAGPWVWNTGGNWIGGTAPVIAADRGDLRKDWTAAAAINFNAPTTTNGVLFDDTGASNDVGVTLGNGGTAANTLTLAGTTPTLNVAGSTLTVSTVLAGTAGFSKTGGGTLLLNNAANTVTGTISVGGGTLQIRDGSTNSPAVFNNLTGKSITVQNTAILDLPRLHATTATTTTWALPAITLESGSTLRFRHSTGSNTNNMAANIATSGATAVTIDSNGGSFSHNIALTGVISGSAPINFYASSASGSTTTTRTLTLNNTGSTFSGNWFVDYTATTTDDFVALQSGAAGSLGTGTVTLDDRARLINNAANGLNSLAGVTLQKATSFLDINGSFAWNNAAAALNLAAGTVSLTSTDSTIGSLTATGSATINSTGGTLTASTVTISAGTLSGTATLVPAASGNILNTAATGGVTITNPIDISNSGVTFNIADLNASGSDIFLSGSLTSSAGFTKSGSGTLALSGATTISGLVTVSGAGTQLQFNNPTTKTLTGGLAGAGNINIGSSSGLVTLSGASSGYTGTIFVVDGASLAGEAATNGNLTLGGTTGANLWPDFTTAESFTANNITLNGVNQIRFTTPPAAGTYSLLKYNGTLTGTAANFATPYRGSSINVTGGVGANEITFTIGAAASLVWNNAAANFTWDNALSANWKNGVTDDVFYETDAVAFDDTPGTAQAIAISGNVSPGSIVFTSTNDTVDYAFSGSSIIGQTSLVKNGDATAKLAMANSYTGGTTLNKGRLGIGNNAALGSGTLTINGGALSSDSTSNWSIANSIMLDGNATLGHATDNGVVTLTGSIALSDDRTITAAADATISGVISGLFDLTKEGSNTLTLTGANTYASTTVNAGVLQVGAGAATGTIPNSVSINAPGTLRFFQANGTTAITLANTFSGDGTLALLGTGVSGQSSYLLTGDNSGLTGVLKVETGARAQANNSSGNRYGSAEVQVSSGGQAYLVAGTFDNTFKIAGNGWTETSGQLGALRVNGTITGPVILTGPARISPFNGTGTLSGTLSGTDALEINASSSASFTGTLNYSGDGAGFTGSTTVSQGTLNLTGSLGGDLLISSTDYAANLAGEGTVGGNLTLGAVGRNATLTIDPTTSTALTVTGNFSVAEPTTVVTLNLTTPITAAGTYTVLNHGGTSAVPANFSLTLVGYRPPNIDTSTDPAKVTITTASENLTWKGTTDVWDINNTANWKSASVDPEKFYQLDSVLLNDTASNFAPTLAVAVTPSSVTFDNSSNDYSLSGAGGIGGQSTLTKSGSGIATLLTTNTYSGTTTINAGTLQVGSAGTAGTLGTGSVINNASLVFNRSNTIIVPNEISGTGTLSQIGTGTLTLTGNSNYTGNTIISAGILQIGNAGTVGNLGTGLVTNNATLAFNRTDEVTFANLVSGTGAVIQSGAGITTLTAANEFNGLTTISAGTLALSSGNNRLPVTNTVAFSGTSNFDITATDQTLAAITVPVANASSSSTIRGTGTLRLNGTVPFNFGPSGSLSAARSATMDMSGLSNFEFDSPTQAFRVATLPGSTTSIANSANVLFLGADTTSIKALSFLVGDQAGSGSGGLSTFRLGESTTIHANNINVGASGRSNGTLNFDTGLTAPKVTIRGTDGFAAVTFWDVGRVANFATTPNTWNANVDLSAGEIDAKVTTLRIGTINTTNQVNRQGIQNSTFRMGKGTLDVANLTIGEQSGTFTNNTAANTYSASGTFTLDHPDGVVSATTLRLAENTGNLTGGTRTVSGTLNLDSGTLAAAAIRLGDQTATSPAAISVTVNFSGGTITHLTGENLSISQLPVNLTGSGTRVFLAGAGRSISTATNTTVSGLGGFTKTGEGALILAGTNTYSGDTLLTEGTLGGTGSSSSALIASPGSTVAPGVTIGTLATAAATLPAGSTLAIQIDSATDTADKLVASGAVDITGATASFSEIGSGIVPAGTKLVILDYTGQTLTGTFAGIAEGATVTAGSNTFTLSYSDASRITLTSTTVDPFASWAEAQITDIDPTAPAGFDDDADGDGFDNGLEWILGGNPLSQDAATLVTTTASATGGLTLTFTREDDSIGQATLTVEYDADLTGTWSSLPVGLTSSGPDANGVTITINPTPDPDAVTVNIPSSNAVGGKLFGRLRASKP